MIITGLQHGFLGNLGENGFFGNFASGVNISFQITPDDEKYDQHFLLDMNCLGTPQLRAEVDVSFFFKALTPKSDKLISQHLGSTP